MRRKLSQHRRRLGQVFLRDALVVDQILSSAELTPTDTVLEIGPGRGALTGALAERVSSLYALEIDAHYTLQKVLRGWLLLHIPVSILIFVLLVIHIFTVTYY